MALVGNELVQVIPITSLGAPSPISEFVTVSQIANLGGSTTPVTITSGPFNLVTPGFYPVHLTVPAPLTINLPSTPPNGNFLIKDAVGNCATNNITIIATGALTIDGASTFVMNINYLSVTLSFNGTNWSLI